MKVARLRAAAAKTTKGFQYLEALPCIGGFQEAAIHGRRKGHPKTASRRRPVE
jgi:hypothetical protein